MSYSYSLSNILSLDIFYRPPDNCYQPRAFIISIVSYLVTMKLLTTILQAGIIFTQVHALALMVWVCFSSRCSLSLLWVKDNPKPKIYIYLYHKYPRKLKWYRSTIPIIIHTKRALLTCLFLTRCSSYY